MGAKSNSTFLFLVTATMDRCVYCAPLPAESQTLSIHSSHFLLLINIDLIISGANLNPLMFAQIEFCVYTVNKRFFKGTQWISEHTQAQCE